MEETGNKSFDTALAQMLAPASEAEETPTNQPTDALEASEDQPMPEELAEELSDAEEISDEDDVAELSSSDDDVEIDDEDLEADLPDEDVQDTLYTVKVDGKEEQWTLEQLKQDASGRAAIDKRFRETAETRKQVDENRKQVEQMAAQVQQQQQQVVAMYQQLQNNGMSQPVAPDRELLETDPIGYMQQEAAYKDDMQQYNQQVQQVQQLQMQQEQRNAYQREAHLATQAEHLKQHLPELVDPDKGEALRKNLISAGGHYGWTPEEMASVADARYVLALNDAMKYRNLVAQKAKRNGGKGKSVGGGNAKNPVVKSSAKRREGGGQASVKKMQQKLRNSGSLDDAMALMMKP